MQNASLRPQLEFELLKLVLLREKYIQRLQNRLTSDNEKFIQTSKAVAKAAKARTKPKNTPDPVLFVPRVDIGLIGLFDVLRDCTVQVVETIKLWERAQLSYPNVASYKWNGQNYLEKMFNDLEFLQDYPYVLNWMGFSPINNPFLVPPEVLREELTVPPNSFIIFGIEPPKEAAGPQRKNALEHTKSPYTTPIINDPRVFTHLSARSKLNAKFKAVEAATDVADGGVQDDHTYAVSIGGTSNRSPSRESARRPGVPRQSAANNSDKPAAGAYQSYLNSELIQKLRACWKKLVSVNTDATQRNTQLNRVVPAFGTAEVEGGASAEYIAGGDLDAAGLSLSAVHAQGSYTESRAFASPELSTVRAEATLQGATNLISKGAELQSPSQRSPLRGLYATSTQTLAALPAGATTGAPTPSALQQMAFQHEKDYFQRSLHDSSGARYAEQDAGNETLRFFPTSSTTQPQAEMTGSVPSGGVGSPQTLKSMDEAVPIGAAEGVEPSQSVTMGPGVHLYTEDSADVTWGSASDLGAAFRTQGVPGAHPANAGIEVRSGLAAGRLGEPVGEIGKGLNTMSSQLWTPHEIHLQRQVQRRGGELHILTAAGTQGRLKAPWRRTRFERLEADVRHLHQQSEIMHMAVEEALTRAVEQARLEGAETTLFGAPVGGAGDATHTADADAGGAKTIVPGLSTVGASEGDGGRPSSPQRVTFATPAGTTTARTERVSTIRRPSKASRRLPTRTEPSPQSPLTAVTEDGSQNVDSHAATKRSHESTTATAEATGTVPASPGPKRARIGGAGLLTQTRPASAPAGGSPATAAPLARAGSPSPAGQPTADGAAADRPATAPRIILTGRGGAVARISAPISVAAMAARNRQDGTGAGTGSGNGSGSDEDAGTDEEQSDEDAFPDAVPITTYGPSTTTLSAGEMALRDAASSEETKGGTEDDNKGQEPAKPLAPIYRVEADIANAIRELKLQSIEVDRRKTFMQYQYDHFRMVTTGSLTDLSKQRRLHRMDEGQTLEEDQEVAMALEDKMAFRIQRSIRRKFGRALRQAMLRKMNAAAVRIQGTWRRCKVHMMSVQRGAQLKLALILQRWYRGGAVNETMRRLKREALERVASKTVQRVFRGYLGRRRLNLKREFVGSLAQATHHVSIKELTPGHVEELADMVDMFVRDYTLDLPTAVLSVLRAVFYMFNGDNSECVVVSKDGYIEKKYIRAATATWSGAKLILRRKCRFLRRLRALVQNTSLPNPSKLVFTPDCIVQLEEVVKGITPMDFNEVELGKDCILKLLEYCKCLYRAYQLQDLFPEYFDPGQSAWFRYLMNIRQKYDRADLARRIQSKCKFRLEAQRREYTREGRSWRHVADAMKRNEFDLEEARVLRAKTKKRYESYLAELEAAELKKVVTLEGIVRAKTLSVQVAQGDLKEYIQSVVIPDEGKLRELYYAIDTRSASLLQTKAEIMRSIEQNERNKQSRDFDKIMRTKTLHDICGDLGAVLADLTVLLNNWKALLKSIGGYQYVKDLVGQRKAYYEHIRKTTLSLLKKRRSLMEAFEADLAAQYAKVVQVAHDLGVKACSTYWDTPTSVEVEAEAEENRECCRREADFELRQRRQTEHVHIPAAPFVPVLLLIDSRIPRKLRTFLTENLQKFDFAVCRRSQIDDNLILEMQSIIDEKRHVILFANRGAHSLARLSFVSAFNSIVSGLIPSPHIVALDCTLALRVEDWHTMFAVDQPGMIDFNVGDSAYCDLSLGKIRNLSSLFRECLVYEEGDIYEDASEESESDDERPGTADTAMGQSRRVSFAASPTSGGGSVAAQVRGETGEAAQAGPSTKRPSFDAATDSVVGDGGVTVDQSSRGDDTVDKVASLPRPVSPKAMQRSGSVTFNVDASTAPAQSARRGSSFSVLRPRRRRLDAVPVPGYVRAAFMTDFHGFVTHIAQKLRTVDARTVVDIRYKVKTPGVTDAEGMEDRMEYGSAPSAPQRSSGLLYSDMVLAATIATILGLWQAPLTEWTGSDIARGSNAFRKRCLKLSYDELCAILEMREFVDSSVVVCKRLERAMEIDAAWEVLRKHDFYVHPARNILARWAVEIVELMTRFSVKGGRADENFNNCNAAHVRHLRWRADVLDPDNSGVQLLGDLLHACMAKALIYEDRNCVVKYYYDRGDLSSTERQCIDSFMTPQHVCVYHSDEETFVGVKVDSSRLLREQTAPNWHFFSRMRVRDLITMLQPNYTEIVQGKVKKFNIKPGGQHQWYKLLSEWASLDNISQQFQITLLRSRYLVLSKLGMVKGYLVRMEIFEERFGEVRILVYGIQESGAVNYPVDRKRVYDLLNYCDVHAEKDKLEALDTQSIAYIFSDRLEVRPSKAWQEFLSHGELLPKALERRVQLHLRKRQGPGRFTGRKVLMVGKVRLVITLFELDSDTNSHELRVVLYETRHSQTAEYRLSSMERLMLFQDDKPLLEQICARLRHVYCDVTDKTRTLLVLDDDDVPRFDDTFEVDGEEEYELRSQESDSESEREDDDDRDSDTEDADNETQESGSRRDKFDTRRGSRRFSSASSGRRRSSLKHLRRGSRRDSRLSRVSRLSSHGAHRAPSGWSWAIYLNRSIVTELKGNLVVSVSVSVPQRGFAFYTYDPRTHREAHRLVTFHDACALSSEKSLESLEDDLGNMDESTAYDLADEFMALVEFQHNESDRLVLVLSGEETESENIVLAWLGEFKAPSYEPRALRKPTIPVQRVTIFVHGAKDLERIGAFGMRNPVCLVKWNFREVGRTKISRNTLNPRWNGASFLVMTPKNQELRDCSLDLELFDTSADGKNKLTDFLGCIKIAGDNLVEFLDSGRPRWVECEKAKRFHGEENRHVKGAIEVSGTRGDTQLAAKAAEAEAAAKAERDSAKLAGFGVSTRFGAPWFAPSSKNLTGSGSDAGDGDSSLKSANQAAAVAVPGLGNLSRKLGLSVKTPAMSAKSIGTIQEDQDVSEATVTPAPQGSVTSPAPPLLAAGGRAASMQSGNWAAHSASELPVGGSSSLQGQTPAATAPAAASAPVAAEAPLAAPPRTAEAKGVPFYLGVVGADGLPSGVEVTCTVKFNSFVVQKLVVTSSQDNYMSAKVAFYSTPVSLCIPPGLPLAACELQVTLTREDPKAGTVPIADTVLRGSMLVGFLRRGAQWVEARRIAPAVPQAGGVGITGLLSTKAPAESALGDLRPCRVELVGSYRPIKQEVYQLRVLSARNLPKADVFGSSDPFVKLLLDGRLVGQTQVVKNNLNPTWVESFTIPLGLRSSILDSTLVIEVYDHDTISDHDLLGIHTVSGAALRDLLCPPPVQLTEDGDEEAAEPEQVLPLEMEQKVKGKTKMISCGELVVQGCGRVQTEASPEGGSNLQASFTAHSSVNSKLDALGSSVTSTGDPHAEEVDPARKIVDDAYEELHNLAQEEYVLTVKSARGLLNTDSLRNSHTMVNVYFNGELVGRTAELPHGSVLDWSSTTTPAPTGGSAKALTPAAPNGSRQLRLVVPRGQPLSSCRLELEVLALEHHHTIGLQMTTTTTATVLGGRVISGAELEQLVGIPQKGTAGTALPSPARRAVGAGGATFFPLESSSRPPPPVASKTGPVPAATPAVAPTESAPMSLLRTGLSFRSSKKESEKVRQRGGAALDASGLAAAANAQNAAAPVNLTPQGDLGLVLRPAGDVATGAGAVHSQSSGVKSITIEEPELIREHSVLELSIMALKDIALAVTSVVGAPAPQQATTGKASTAAVGAAAQAEGSFAIKSVDVVIRWNGIIADKILALVDTRTGTVQLPVKAMVALRLPFNLQITDCHLEVLVWCDRVLLGSSVYWGEDLADICGAGSQRTADKDGDDDDGAEGEEGEGASLGKGDKLAAVPAGTEEGPRPAVVTSSPPLWHSLRPSQIIPTSLHAPKISGRILLGATLTRPVLQKKSIVITRDPNRKRTFFRVIKSDLTAEKKHWSYAFPEEPEEVTRKGRRDSIDDLDDVDEPRDTVPALPTEPRVFSSPSGPARKRLASDMSSDDHSSLPAGRAGAGAGVGAGAAAGGDADGEDAALPTVDVGRMGIPDPGAKHQKLRLELAAISFTVTVHQEIDDFRICWRGRVMPKNFHGSEGTRKAMMASRASRLVRTHGINDMQVMAEIHQLQDTGEEGEEINDLPICVKEVLSDGPGLVKRTYRVDISANNGVLMGSADIKDNVVEFERVVGKEHIARLLPADRKQWKLGNIFQHVVRERVVLDMLLGKGKAAGKDGRREGLIQKHEELAELTGSIISIMRDPSPEEVAKAARAAKEAADQAETAANAVADAAIAKQADANKFGLGGLGLNLKGFKFGFGKKAAEPVAAVVEEDSLVLDTMTTTNETQRATTPGLFSTHTHSVQGDGDPDDDEGRRISHKVGRIWLRIHARTHRVVGMPLRSVVLLLTTPDTNPLFHENKDRYFKQVTGRTCLLQFDILFRCKNSFTKDTRELYLTAAELDEWLPKSHVVDMTTRFRRDKLGAYLLQYLSIRFTEAGRVSLYLIRENAHVSSSIDDLIAEDEQQQQDQEDG